VTSLAFIANYYLISEFFYCNFLNSNWTYFKADFPY